jgi:ketosteroid isomerase-like protein
MSQAWDTFDMVEQSVLTATSPLVVLTQVHARSRATGRELHFPILQTITTEDGRITEIRPFYWDTAAITNACVSA